MRNASSAMIQRLANHQFFITEIYTITLANGDVYRWTEGGGGIIANVTRQSGDTLLRLNGTYDDVSPRDHQIITVDTPPAIGENGIIFDGSGHIAAYQTGTQLIPVGLQRFEFIIRRTLTNTATNENVVITAGLWFVSMRSDRLVVGTWSESATECFFNFENGVRYEIKILNNNTIGNSYLEIYVNTVLIQRYPYGYNGFAYAGANINGGTTADIDVGGWGLGNASGRLHAELEYLDWTVNIVDINVTDAHTLLLLERQDITLSTGVSVDDCAVTLYFNDDSVFNDLPVPHFARIGGFDNAHIKIEMAIMETYGDTLNELINLFEGRVTDTVINIDSIELTVSSEFILLDTKIPAVVYQPSCVHTLYDGKCGLNQAAFTQSCVVLTGSWQGGLIFASGYVAGFLTLGKVTFTSGANRGLSRTIREHLVGTVNLAELFPFAPVVGDTFTVSAGCDKTRSTCAAKFSNAAQFLGWEYMPVPEASV